MSAMLNGCNRLKGKSMEKQELLSEEKDVKGLFQLVEIINAKGDKDELNVILAETNEGNDDG